MVGVHGRPSHRNSARPQALFTTATLESLLLENQLLYNGKKPNLFPSLTTSINNAVKGAVSRYPYPKEVW